MEKFIEEASKSGITSKALEDMVQRDLEYKNDIYKKIRGIRNRQILSISLALLLVGISCFILLKVFENLDSINEIIRTLMYGFGQLNT